MKKSFILVFLTFFFLLSCGKSEEIKTHVDSSVSGAQQIKVKDPQKSDSGASVESLDKNAIVSPDTSSGTTKKVEKESETLVYRALDTTLTFDYPKKWEVQSRQDTFEGVKRQIITIHTDSFKVGKSLSDGERDTSIKIDLYISDKKEAIDGPIGMFFGDEFLKSLTGKNGKILFVKGYIHYLTSNPLTEETPGVLPYFDEIEFYNDKYRPVISRLVESIHLP